MDNERTAVSQTAGDWLPARKQSAGRCTVKTANQNAARAIVTAMRKNERAVVNHIRKYGLGLFININSDNITWQNALDRLIARRRVRYNRRLSRYQVMWAGEWRGANPRY